LLQYSTLLPLAENAYCADHNVIDCYAGNMYQGGLRDEQLLHGENGIDGSTPLSQVGATNPPTHVSNKLIFKVPVWTN